MGLWSKLFGTSASTTPKAMEVPPPGMGSERAIIPPRDRYVLLVDSAPWVNVEGGMNESEHLRLTLQEYLPDVLVRGKIPKDGEGGTVFRSIRDVAPRDPDHMIQLALSAFDVEFMSHGRAFDFEIRKIDDGLPRFGFSEGKTVLIATRKKKESSQSGGQSRESRNVAPRVASEASPGRRAPADDERDRFIASCLDVPYREMQEDRWFSHFKELPEIDALRKSGKPQEALSLCRKGLEQHPDSFLFYKRGADLCEELGQPDEAERLLVEGLSKSLSKCSIAGALADRAFANLNNRDAIRWWIVGGVLQLDAKIMVDKMPFLNLAYVCQPIGITETERWLFEMADRASSQGPVRFNAEGAELRHWVARTAMAAGDDAAQHAIVAFHDKYK